MDKVVDKFLNMTREEEIVFISEAINGKPKYSDTIIALGMLMKARNK